MESFGYCKSHKKTSKEEEGTYLVSTYHCTNKSRIYPTKYTDAKALKITWFTVQTFTMLISMVIIQLKLSKLTIQWPQL
jgi:hypothetical protein